MENKSKEMFFGIKKDNEFELIIVDDESYQLLLSVLSKYDNDAFLKYKNLELALKYEAIYEQPDPNTEGLRIGIDDAEYSHAEFKKEEAIFGIKTGQKIQYFDASGLIMVYVEKYDSEIWSKYGDVCCRLKYAGIDEFDELTSNETKELEAILENTSNEITDLYGLVAMCTTIFDGQGALGEFFGHDLIEHCSFDDRVYDYLQEAYENS